MPSQQQIAFAALLSRNSQIIYKVCWMYSYGSEFYFEELRGQAAIVLWREFSRYGMERFRGEGKESTWVYRVAVNAAKRYLSNPHNKQLDQIGEGTKRLIIAEDSNISFMIEELMQQLDDSEKQMLGHFLENHPFPDIAKLEGISEVAARKRMSRLFIKLKKLVHK